MARFDILHEIERLDPVTDHQRIVHLSFGYEFPWDSIRALEIALYRTYCVPSISALLDRTGEFHQNTQRRYDDTSILVAEMCEWGYESGRGKEALERMNWAHSHFKIANDDFLYVLSTFIFEPVRWIDAVGWRPTCRNERLGYYYFWRGIGSRMGITAIPPSVRGVRSVEPRLRAPAVPVCRHEPPDCGLDPRPVCLVVSAHRHADRPLQHLRDAGRRDDCIVWISEAAAADPAAVAVVVEAARPRRALAAAAEDRAFLHRQSQPDTSRGLRDFPARPAEAGRCCRETREVGSL